VGRRVDQCRGWLSYVGTFGDDFFGDDDFFDDDDVIPGALVSFPAPSQVPRHIVKRRLRAARPPISSSPVHVTRPSAMGTSGSMRPHARSMNVSESVLSVASGFGRSSVTAARPSTFTSMRRVTGPVMSKAMPL